MHRIKNIKDLAEIAGVSAGTVSRALSGSSLISVQTRQKVQALADEYGFRPNIMARNLRIQRTGSIGVLIPLGHAAGQHISDPFFITMLGLLADALTERGYDLVLSRVVPEGSDWLDRFVDSSRVDGLIVIGQRDQARMLDEAATSYKPLVAWGGWSAGQVHCSVGSDNRKGGELAADHLIARNCRRIAFFGDPSMREVGQRLEGCREAVRRAGLEGELSVYPGEGGSETMQADVAGFMAIPDEHPRGLFAASDVMAMGLLQVLAELGYRVPDDVRVIGYDGLAIGEHTVPRLSTIVQDLTAGAAQLVDMLLRRIAGDDTHSVVMEPKLLVRMSS